MQSTKIGTKIFLLGVILLILAVISDAKFDRQVRAASRKFCGAHLVDTLSILCENGYNSFSKKSVSSEDYYIDQLEERAVQIPGFPFVPKSNRMISENSFRRIGRGVTDECCQKSCSFVELRSYCL